MDSIAVVASQLAEMAVFIGGAALVVTLFAAMVFVVMWIGSSADSPDGYETWTREG